MNAHTSRKCDSAFLDREITVAFGASKTATRWLNETLTLRRLLARQGTHKVGKKDGSALLQGELIGTERKAAQVKSVGLLIVDLDTGRHTLDEIAGLIRERGLFAFLWNTHSHGTQQTSISDEKLRKFRPGLPAEAIVRDADNKPAFAPGVHEAIIAFLRESEEYDARVTNSVWSVTLDPKAGEWTVMHAPIDKVRALFVLEEPFAVGDASGAATWAARYADVCKWLDVPFDKACADASRLFFLLRRPAGSDPECFKTLVVEGKPLNLDLVPKSTEEAGSESRTDDPPGLEYVEDALRLLVERKQEHFNIEDYKTWLINTLAPIKLDYGRTGKKLAALASCHFNEEDAENYWEEPKHEALWNSLKRETGKVRTSWSILHEARELGWTTINVDFADIFADNTANENTSDAGAEQSSKSETQPPPAFEVRAYEWTEPEKIKPRQWLGRSHHHIREFVTVTASPGGKGKTSLALVEALEMVTGRRLLVEKPDTEATAAPLRVYYWNGEDP